MGVDQDLVTAILNGDERAFTYLVNRYRYPVFGLCLGYVGDFDLAEDVTQETFVLAYQNLHTLADAKFLGPWLKRIAINRCRSLWRRSQRWVRLSDEDEKTLASGVPLIDVKMMEREKRDEVLKAIDRLPEAPRQVLTLFYLEGLSLRQIATFLGIREASAKQRLYRARMTFKEEMLEMIKNTVGGHELPPDFTEQVVKEALSQGHEKLKEHDWKGAQVVFRKVVDVLPEHLEANRGLGLALGGEVEGRQRNTVFDDDVLAQESFEALQKAYALGANDDRVVRRLAQMYSSFGRNREGGQFLEQVAKTRTDWRDQFALLSSAISIYYHSHYRNGEDNKTDCVRCHQEIRSLVPADSDVRTKLAIWCPPGLALAYPHVGLAQEVFDEMDRLEQDLDDTCSVWDYYFLDLIRSNTHRELEQWEDVIDVGRSFVLWVNDLPKGDRRFDTAIKIIRPDASDDERVGAWVRYHVVLFTLNTLARAEHTLGRPVADTFAQMDQTLIAHEAYVKDLEKVGKNDQVKKAKRWLGGDYTRAGEAAFLTQEYERALAYFDQEEALLGKLEMHNSIYRVGALAGIGRTGEAIERLDAITGRLVTTGQWRTTFETHRVFDAIRNDDRVLAIMDRWKKSEGITERHGRNNTRKDTEPNPVTARITKDTK